MEFKVTVEQLGESLRVPVGATILETALAAGLDYPHGCRSGNCGACKSRLVDGEVDLAPYSEFALSDAERAQGLILACRAVPWSDCTIAWLAEDEAVLHPRRHLHCRVAEREPVTHDIVRLRLAIESGGPYTFTPGQFASLRFAGLAPRDYSMASLPHEPLLEFHIRAIAGGAVSPYVQRTVAVGDPVKVEGPYGVAYLRTNHTGPIIALAGGSGLAPIKAIVRQALADDPQRRVELYFGVRDERDLYDVAGFDALAARHPRFQFIPVLSAPRVATPRPTGRLADVIAGRLGDLTGAKAYLAGPPPMVETCLVELGRAGLAPRDCHADAFYTAADRALAA